MSQTPDKAITVWVVEPLGYDEYGIEGVFDSAEAAKASITWLQWRAEPEDDGRWLTTRQDPALNGGYKAYPTPVQTLSDVESSREEHHA